MSYKPYEPNPVIVDRAVELWKRMLAHPKYDNGDQSQAGGFGVVLAHMIDKNNTPDVLEKFGVALREELLTKKQRGDYGFYEAGLHVDYGPDGTLSAAAEKAGLKMQFPWKTNMHLNETYLCVMAGYCAESVYHYPLPGGRWLITTLSGSEMDKVIEYVTGGRPQFVVEEIKAAAPLELKDRENGRLRMLVQGLADKLIAVQQLLADKKESGNSSMDAGSTCFISLERRAAEGIALAQAAGFTGASEPVT